MTEIMKSAIVTDNSVTIVVDGNTRAINDAHPNYVEIREAVRSQTWEKIADLLDVKKSVQKWTHKSSPRVTVDDNYGRLVVRYDGEVVNGFIVERIIRQMKEGFDASPLVAFLENVQENPSKRAVDDLYEFLERGNLPITPDGHILAYKNVRGDYTDIHSGTMDNSVGQIVEMPRNRVNEDPNQTCSSGLHFCSQEYLPSFSHYEDGHTMIVKVNPRDVVAFPRDYNMSKVRCCRYEVVGEHNGGKAFETPAFDTSVDTKWSPATEPKPVTKQVLGRIVSLADAAKIFGCTEDAVRKRCQRGVSARYAGANKVEILDHEMGILDNVIDVVRECTDATNINLNSRLVEDLGLDELEDIYSIELKFGFIESIETISDLVDLITTLIQIDVGSVVTIQQAAWFFGCTESAVRNRCRRGVSARYYTSNGQVQILKPAE
jgi:acyl carrier protein